jgi:hypothetical protein
MRNIFVFFLLLFFSVPSVLNAQDEDSIEVFLIDSYVTPELPHRFILSFFTSEGARSKVMIDDNYEFTVSDTLTDNHKTEIDVTDLDFMTATVPYFIIVENADGKKYYSEKYEFELPYETKVKGGSGMFTMCLFGSVVFILPSPTYVRMDQANYFSLTKEVPLIFIRSSGLGYPTGYFSAEYSHIFNAPVKNLLRLGYKHLIDIPGIEYISPGLGGFTNFKGFNGISPELSLGLFKLYNVFTVYTRYRYNTKPGSAGSEFHEISIGLYSGFFAVYL